VKQHLNDPCIKIDMRWCELRGGFCRGAAAVALILSAVSARAEGTPIPHGTVELVAQHPSITAGHTLNLGLHFNLDKGWHIYWVNPGDSGEPPRVDWQLPAGLTVGTMEWPAPRRLGASSIVDFGYEDGVMLIVPMLADASLKSQQPAQLGAEVRMLVCSHEMCVPGKAQLSLTLPIKPEPPVPDVRNRDLFAATEKSVPRPAPRSWKFSVAEGNNSFVLTASLSYPIKQAIFFPLAESQIENAAPQELQPMATGFRLRLRKSDQLVKPIDRLKGVLVLPANQAYWIDVPIVKPGAARRSGTKIQVAQP
jgi:DsbC/DsbD-like thiol-disulfide interchange protein